MAPEYEARYGSDVLVDVLIGLGVKYVALNPGATFRGLHDSLVNVPGGPEMIVCTHEKTAVGVAHGYAKATGEPMAVVLHNLVGLLHGSMGLFYAFHDRVPMLVLGGSGPADTARRRPAIDWYHSANVQGNAVRDFVKWDDEPRSLEASVESLARAWLIANETPRGPVYVALDADLQEQELSGPGPATDVGRYSAPTPMAPDADAIAAAVDLLVGAARPVVIAGHAGRDPATFTALPRLAEILGAAVVDLGPSLNLPTTHPLNLTGGDAVRESDCVLLLDCKDAEPALTECDTSTRETRWVAPPDTRLISVGSGSHGIRGWSHDHGRLLPATLNVRADVRPALQALIDGCAQRIAAEPPAVTGRRNARRADLESRHRELRDRWSAVAETRSADTPVSLPWLARELWHVVRDHDWVLTAGTANGWAKRLWDFDRAYRHPGDSLGTATQIGLSLGVALAHKGTGRLVVDLQPDGDLMYDLGALWIAAHHRIPMLVVMVNNRAYQNDWAHQEHVAQTRQRPVERARIGLELADPAPDFASTARAQGWWASGPVARPDEIRKVLVEAAAVVVETGQPALVDVVTERG